MQDTVIKNQARFRQRVKFDKFQGCQATDIDYFCDVKGKAFIYGEFKVEGQLLPLGQKIAAENLVKNSKIPVFFIFSHHTTDPDEDIVAADTIVHTIWYSEGNGSCHESTKYQGMKFSEVKAKIEMYIKEVKKKKK